VRFGLFQLAVFAMKQFSSLMSRSNPFSRIPFNLWLLLFGVLAVFVVQRYFPTSQVRNLRAASEHVGVLNVLFQQDPRFASLKARPWTGKGGIIWVMWEDDEGNLVDRTRDEDVPDVIEIIKSTQPPVIVRFRDVWINNGQTTLIAPQ